MYNKPNKEWACPSDKPSEETAERFRRILVRFKSKINRVVSGDLDLNIKKSIHYNLLNIQKGSEEKNHRFT